MNKYKEYAEQVVNGKITACSFIILAAKRYLSWFDRTDIYFDTKAVDKVVDFIQHLKHYTGEYNGKPFILQPWQFWLICSIFGWKHKENNLRVTRTFYLEIGRKNGKSSLLSAIALYMLIGDREQNASCITAANSAKQASLLFQMASNYLKSVDPKARHFKRYRDSILFEKTTSKMQVVAADSSKLDGLNCSFFVTDELHEAPDSRVYDVLETSQGSRLQPLACACTTAGFNLSSFCYELRKNNVEVLNGMKTDDTLQAFIFTLDEKDDWKDENVWVKANPNLDISVKKEFIKQQIVKATNNPIQEISIRTKLMNQWLSSSNTWIPMNYIFDSTKKINIDDFKDYFCYVGVDLAAVSDLTCCSWMIELDGKYYYKNFYYLPETVLNNNSNSELYRQWHHQGYLTLTPGNVTDTDYVSNEILKINKKTPIEIVSYDRYLGRDWAVKLTAEGINMQPFSQSIGSMTIPTKELQRLIMSGKVVIDDNPITRFCFQNSVAKLDVHDNIQIVKESNQQKIDGVVAMIIALGGKTGTPVYNNEIATLKY